MTTAPDEAPPHSDRWRALATRAVGLLGGLPAVRTLVAVLTAYDRAGGGLIASGLAYAALLALLPGMLLVLSIFALVVSDEATRERIVSLIAEAIPPLEEVVRTAFEQVCRAAARQEPSAILRQGSGDRGPILRHALGIGNIEFRDEIGRHFRPPFEI